MLHILIIYDDGELIKLIMENELKGGLHTDFISLYSRLNIFQVSAFSFILFQR